MMAEHLWSEFYLFTSEGPEGVPEPFWSSDFPQIQPGMPQPTGS